MDGYCENGDCRVILFLTSVDPNVEPMQNCPGCGEFGRFKDLKK